MQMKKIKICGITTETEIEYLAEAGVDYAGFVQFFPKSKRNIPLERARDLIRLLPASIRPVAVTVSPKEEQLEAIVAAGFSLVQIHGAIDDEVIRKISIPVLKAFNVSDLEAFSRYEQMDQVVGFVLDAPQPGSGQVFDWSVLKELPVTEKMILLAGRTMWEERYVCWGTGLMVWIPVRAWKTTMVWGRVGRRYRNLSGVCGDKKLLVNIKQHHLQNRWCCYTYYTMFITLQSLQHIELY